VQRKEQNTNTIILIELRYDLSVGTHTHVSRTKSSRQY